MQYILTEEEYNNLVPKSKLDKANEDRALEITVAAEAVSYFKHGGECNVVKHNGYCDDCKIASVNTKCRLSYCNEKYSK